MLPEKDESNNTSQNWQVMFCLCFKTQSKNVVP